MASFYLDTSALIKRYMAEKGTQWVIKTIFVSSNYISIARITHAEVASTFARKLRSKAVTPDDEIQLRRLFQRHLNNRFAVVEIDAAICSQAAALSRKYPLRGYDSVQLACALKTAAILKNIGGGRLTFLAADADLLKAASAEGLTTDNPENH